ncbi:MAG: hypothetical protein ACLR60_08370 [Clostridium paraputrificum]
MKGFDYMKGYRIFNTPYGKGISHKSKLRVDLFGDMKISDIEELKDFNIFYISQGHEDFITLKGALVKRKVRYIQVFEK